jgi:PadR family transcriptional regulator PadR
MPTRPDTLQGSLPLLVLTILSRRGPLHGYGITAHIQRLSDALRTYQSSEIMLVDHLR